MDTLGDAFQRQIERCRELLSRYEAIGPAGSFGAVLIRDVIARAEAAQTAGDVVAMVRLYREMEGLE